MNAKVIVIWNSKGGVGKTCACANIGGVLAAGGSRVLLIDADPSANLSISFPDAMRSVDAPYPNLLRAFMMKGHKGTLPREWIYRTITQAFPNANEHERREKKQARERLLVAPAQRAAFVESPPLGEMSEMVMEENFRTRANGESADYLHLSRFVDSVREDFDYILIDAPGTTEGVLYLEALCAADYVVAPAEIDSFSPAALETLRFKTKQASDLSGREICFLGYFLSRFFATRTRTDVMARDIMLEQESDLFVAVVPNSSAVKNVQLTSDVLAFAMPAEDVTRCFEQLTDEIRERIQKTETRRKGEK